MTISVYECQIYGRNAVCLASLDGLHGEAAKVFARIHAAMIWYNTRNVGFRPSSSSYDVLAP
ncbi:MAG: hypothetical protein Q4G10_09570, partial [Bacteroidia bacterium]|nr:hypothetical protein [Bacteroidia bacterium]